ncbi:Ca2+-binding RTX toxin-like protein [Rhizobium sp. SG_E_25_P2]|uniref:beta strand repeat-containing protein n=1 Tax=Rhizobium sp. SG_E_25_P2 TaxID=2879942 RepID=UPI002473A8AD|nr:calcium-binding protein [Rhizobium sp. SG_E_25_P2]MDH6264815.1 Ca2+-binding RTX toxin-like protein [Rhizobium sp. SG_E_25_P2]
MSTNDTELNALLDQTLDGASSPAALAAAGDTVTGTAGNETLTGTDGDDVIDGGAGVDRMVGGAGDDTYIVDNAGDATVEEADGGVDTVQSAVTLTLGDFLENLTLLGSGNIIGTGNSLDNVLIGNTGNNTLIGLAGDDVLDGGAGADRMAGGLGDDIYVMDNASDVIIEDANSGVDTIRSSVNQTLGNNIENIVLLGSSNINGTGNSVNNSITGNTGDNTLSGAAGDDALFGLAGNDTLDGGAGADRMEGGAGNDTYLVDDADDLTIEDADAGVDTVRSSIGLTLADNIENLELLDGSAIDGAGNALDNRLTGNSGNNILSGGGGSDTLAGGAGNDRLDGGAGADRMEGGNGNDTYIVDNAGDLVVELGNDGSGNDTVKASVSYTLTDFVDTLILAGSANLNGAGNDLNNTITGNSGNNSLSGGEGNDTLNGGAGGDTLDGGADADRLVGGDGDDIYVVDNGDDEVVELVNDGRDLVRSAVSYTLTANVEDLLLQGGGTIEGSGNNSDNSLTGNAAKNVLRGFGGEDLLDGGLGADRMEGGADNDTYLVDDVNDQAVESGNSGFDTVRSSVTFTLGANVEELVLVGSGDLDGTGNSLDNVIIGTSGVNLLDGGSGADTLQGGAGNDTYIVDDIDDLVIEDAGAGDDIVQTSVTWALGANLEKLVLLGSSAINGTGNSLDNQLTGNSNANTLDGGAGADVMEAGGGNDIYIVDNIGDKAVEAANAGTDAVRSSVSFSLGDNLEKLILTGSANLDATGNQLANELTGNTGNNLLDGGAGADLMVGGLGNDVYVVDNIGDVVSEAANAGIDTVRSSINLTLVENLENLVLLGSTNINGVGNNASNVITGNTGGNTLSGANGNDTLIGLAGDDTLDGGADADRMEGGAGNDTYIVDNANDVTVEDADAGTDTVQSSITLTLRANVENLVLTGSAGINGSGNSLDNTITGNGANNTLSGGGGNDILFGLNGNDTLDGGAGGDRMEGGNGDDIYIVDDAGDLVVELGNDGSGNDTVRSSVTYTLTDFVDTLILTGSANLNGAGTDLGNTLTGNTGDNILNGLDGNDLLNGGAGNDTLDGGAGSDRLAGGLGDDTYIVDNGGDNIVEDANAGTDTVRSSINLTLVENLENLVLLGAAAINGTGNALDNSIVGNSARNILIGLGGNDTLDGGAGNDRMEGGAGNDVYIVDNAADEVVEAAGSGSDSVRTSISLTLVENVEALLLLGNADINGTGNGLDNLLTGNAGANSLDGGAGNDNLKGLGGNDTLDGGQGIDRLEGGSGDDTYLTDGVDIIIEDVDGGIDTVRSTSNNAALGTNVENLVLFGTLGINGAGNELDNELTGNAGANTLTGNAGDDTLDGGDGVDRLEGGLGDDIYITDGADVIVEDVDGGIDTVRSSGNNTKLSANVESLVLLGTLAISGGGNELDNVLTGNASANTLTGNGGADMLDGGDGIDRLDGGDGDDIYILDDAGDTDDLVIEDANAGTDTVRASINHTLAVNVENLVLLDTGSLLGTGNDGANTITGNSGDNTLFGLSGNDMLNGGAGADRMEGGVGNDTYMVDNSGDVVIEAADAGVDTVRTARSYTLTVNFENLVLIGSGNVTGAGNSLKNVITGNNGDNTLNGANGNDTLEGGDGADTLNGGAGNDRLIDGAGDDNLVGGNGNDRIEASAGKDRLTGNIGADTLVGGADADRFIFKSLDDSTVASSGRDVISDFSHNQADKIDLASIDASTKNSGNQTFAFIGENAFSGAAGELRYVNSGGDTFIHGDVNGDKNADFTILIDATIDFVKGDFIL